MQRLSNFRWLTLLGMVVTLFFLLGLIHRDASRGQAVTSFQTGDVFAGVGNGQVWRYSPTGGTPLQKLDTTTDPSYRLVPSALETGMCFRKDGQLLTTNFTDSTMTRFENNADVYAGVVADPIFWGLEHEPDHPESCVRDDSGDIYTGWVTGTNGQGGKLIKLDQLGNTSVSWSPDTDNRGIDWIDLEKDQCTMLYTSEGRKVKSFNVCANGGLGMQNQDFTAHLTGGPLTGPCFALRIRSNGEVMVTCQEKIYRLSSTGTAILQTYPESTGPRPLYKPGTNPPVLEDGQLFAMNLDPDGKTFWTGVYNSGNIYRIDIATGNTVFSFTAPPLGPGMGGLAIYGEPTASSGSITICKQTNPADSTQGFTFEDAGSPAEFILNDNDCKTITPSTGTYNFSEHPTPGWALTNIECSGGSSIGFFRSPGQVFVLPFFQQGDTGVRINLASREHVICTFFNTYFPCAAPGGSDISTGIHTTGTGYGLVDPIWTVSAPPPAPTGAAFAVEPVNAPGTWAAPPVGTNWIDPNNTGGPNPGPSAPSDPEGLYEYVTSFSIPAGPLALNINYAADNSVFFTLTGPSPSLLGSAFTRGDPAFHAPLKPASYFDPSANAGTYTLHAFVTNNLSGNYPGNGNPTGLLVAGTVRCINTESVGGGPVGGLVDLATGGAGSSHISATALLAGVLFAVAAIGALGVGFRRARAH